MMLGGLSLAPPLTKDELILSKCAVGGDSTQPVNLTYPILIVFCISLIPGVLFVSCFDTPYRRLNAELDSVNDAVVENRLAGIFSITDLGLHRIQRFGSFNPIPYGLRPTPIPYGGDNIAPLSKIP